MAEFRIAIIGGTVWGNRGAAAMLESIIGHIGFIEPQAKFVVFTYYPGPDRALLSNPKVTIMGARPIDLALSLFPGALWVWLWSALGVRWPDRMLPRGVVELRRCRILLDIAGVSFADGRTEFLPFNILCIWPAMLLGVPVGKCSQAMGPFRTKLNRLVARTFLGGCAFIHGRGHETMSHLQDLGLSELNCELAPDLAFLHRPEYALSQENIHQTCDLMTRVRNAKTGTHQLVCFSPSSLVAAKCAKAGIDYTGVLAALAHSLIGRGYRILVLPTATRAATGNVRRNNDLRVVGSLVEAIGPECCDDELHWIDWDINYATVKWCMAEADAVIASRFHAVVTALSLGLPTLALSWGHKYGELLAHFGLDDCAVDFTDIDETVLIERSLALLDSREAIRAKIATALPVVEEAAARQIDRILVPTL